MKIIEKKLIGEILDFIKSEINNDNFVFSRMHQEDKKTGQIKSCVMGHIQLRNKDLWVKTSKACMETCMIASDINNNRLVNYLFGGFKLELKDSTKGKTLVSKQPILTPRSSYNEVLNAWQFIYDNYDKVVKAL